MRSRFPFDFPYGTVKHEHSTIKHEHGMTGSIAVDPERAVAAFRWALAAIDELSVKYADDIAAEEKAMQDAENDRHARYKRSMEAYEKAIAEQDAARSTQRELELKSKNSFWGLNREDRAKLKAAKSQAEEYVPFPFMPPYYFRKYSTGDILRLRAAVETQLAQCAVALDCSHMNPYWAACVYRIEQGATEWAEKQAPFNQYAKKDPK